MTPDHPTKPVEVHASIWGRDYVFESAEGVFSAHRLDPGTAVLLRSVEPPADEPLRLLDLGCGFGPIATALAVECPSAQVDAVDVNDLAIGLTRTNAVRFSVADRLHAGHAEDFAGHLYDEIWSNPPIRIGKQPLHELLLTWLNQLAPGGHANLVVGKNLGGDSLQTWLTDQGFPTERLASAKGFRVLRTQPRHPAAG
jgi:16S rRNA G1207 methylase RsmC